MAQANFDWIVGEFTTLHDPRVSVLTGPPPFQVPQKVSFTFGLVNENDLEQKEDSLRVERVIGDSYALFARSTTGGFAGFGCGLTERIYVTELDSQGVELLHDLVEELDFDRTWMWQRRRWMPDVTAVFPNGNGKEAWSARTSQSSTHPWWNVINVNVKARLRDRQVLLYHMQFDADPNAPFGEEDTLMVAPMLRVGVKF